MVKKTNKTNYDTDMKRKNDNIPRYDNIEYSDDWESIPIIRAEPVHIYSEYDDLQDEEIDNQQMNKKAEKKTKKKKENSNPQPVLKLQIFLAVILLATAFILKTAGGDFYAAAKEWYFTNLNNSLIASLLPDTENLTDNINNKQSTTEEKNSTLPAENITENTTDDATNKSSIENIADEAINENTTENYTDIIEEITSPIV